MLMRYDEAGHGEPVVLLHSGVGDRRMWEPQWVRLAAEFRVVRCDLRGYGDTPLPPGPFTWSEDVADLLDHLGMPSASVVGSSFGGRIALDLAATRPERVRRLVLLCPGFRGLEQNPDADAFDRKEEELLAAGDHDGFVELNVATWLGPDVDAGAAELVRTMQRRALEVQLAAESGPEQPEPVPVDVDPAAIGTPATIVTGRHDMDHFRAVAKHLAGTMPRARLVELDWAGHLPSMERPDEITDLLIEALRGR
jgi:pimeloyl-ACP methyl ester carboxylesterase